MPLRKNPENIRDHAITCYKVLLVIARISSDSMCYFIEYD